MEKKGIQSFTDLKVWQEGHKLVLATYKAVAVFPREEKYALGDQMRRAATSVTSNIAEGFGRQGVKEKLQFYFLAKGSLAELKNQLLIAKDVGYLKQEDFAALADGANVTDRLLQGFIRTTKSRLS
jgi:four helix bundle protein